MVKSGTGALITETTAKTKARTLTDPGGFKEPREGPVSLDIRRRGTVPDKVEEADRSQISKAEDGEGTVILTSKGSHLSREVT